MHFINLLSINLFSTKLGHSNDLGVTAKCDVVHKVQPP